jgi:hypothetical protein
MSRLFIWTRLFGAGLFIGPHSCASTSASSNSGPGSGYGLCFSASVTIGSARSTPCSASLSKEFSGSCYVSFHCAAGSCMLQVPAAQVVPQPCLTKWCIATAAGSSLVRHTECASFPAGRLHRLRETIERVDWIIILEIAVESVPCLTG